MQNRSLAAQKITSFSRLPPRLANDPPPSPSLKKTTGTASAGASSSSRLKSKPPPSGPSRTNSSYNFKATDPPGTSLLTPTQSLLAPTALSPNPSGIPPGTPLLHAAATVSTTPVPSSLDLNLTEIAQPVPIRPGLGERSSYSQSLHSPLPTIQEDRLFRPDTDIVSPRARLAAHRRGSGFFATFGMDGVDEIEMQRLGRRRSGSAGFEEGWPLPPSPGLVVERRLNTPGEPRRSSLIDKDAVGRTMRDASGSGSSSAAAEETETSKSESQTNLSGVSAQPAESSKTSLSLVEEEPATATVLTGSDVFDFSPSFNGPASRKPSANELTSPHTRQNSPVAEAELAAAAEGEEMEIEDWHSIRSHMTRVTTLGANSVLLNMSMATPNMALPTPEELQLAAEKKDLRTRYLQGNAKSGTTVDDGGKNGGNGRADAAASTSTMNKIKSAAYPFPRTKSDKKGKGKEKETEDENTAPRNGILDFFKTKSRRAREEAERKVDEQIEAIARMEMGYNGYITPPLRNFRRATVEDALEPHPGVRLIDDGDPFHDNFATSSSASAIPSLTSSNINFIRNSNGTIRDLRGVPLGQYPKEVVDVPGSPGVPVGQFPAMSSALARNASLDRNRASCFAERFKGPTAEKIGPDGEPLSRQQLSHEEPKVYEGSSSSSEDAQAEAPVEIQPRRFSSLLSPGGARRGFWGRPGLESRRSTVRDLETRRTSTVVMVRSGGEMYSQITVQETNGSMDSDEIRREGRLRRLSARRRSSARARRENERRERSMRGASSVEEPGVGRRISEALHLQGGFGGRRMTTDGRGGITTSLDNPAKERNNIFSNILSKFTGGEKNDAIADKLTRPPLGADGGDGNGAPMRKKSSWWRRRIEPDENGKLPVLRRMQEAIKRGNSSAMPAPA